MNFEQFNFDRRITAGIRAASYSQPTPIQQQAIPVALKQHDLLGMAQTGTGKTAAFILPILQHLSRNPSRHIQALIIVPTRELAEQIHLTAISLGRYLHARSVTIYGGVSRNRQVDALRKGADIVVACPGRLLDLLSDSCIDLFHIEMLVLDEADRMCDMGFLPDIRRILKQIPVRRQTMFFAATMPDEIRKLADNILHDPVNVQVGMIAPTETVSHALYPVHQPQKTSLAINLLQQTATGRVLIFTRTKYRARSLAGRLKNEHFRTASLEGNMSQNQRQSALEGFRAGKFDILVATDVAARGIDVANISHVINFDMPDSVDAYIHRIGRTGRAQASGEAFTLCVPEDEGMIKDIEHVLGSKIKREHLPGFDYTLRDQENAAHPSQTTRGRHSSAKAPCRQPIFHPNRSFGLKAVQP